MKRLPVIIYVVVGVINVLGHYLGEPGMIKFTKPMLMPVLMFLIYDQAQGAVTLRHMLLFVALFFAWLGDLALMQSDGLFFKLGLGAFLLTHVLYIFIYYKACFERPEFRLNAILPILTYGIFLMAFLLPVVSSDMKIPVAVYALAIIAMACMARLRLGLTSNASYQWVLMGSMLFVVSDSLIALEKFKFIQIDPRFYAYSGVLVMTTYIIAQLQIVRGILDHPE